MSKILVVDDEKLIVKGIRFSLEQDDMTVLPARGAAGAGAAENGKPGSVPDRSGRNDGASNQQKCCKPQDAEVDGDRGKSGMTEGRVWFFPSVI